MNFFILLHSFGFCIQFSIYSDDVVGIKQNSREEHSGLMGLSGWLTFHGCIYTVPKEWPECCSEDTCLFKIKRKLPIWSFIKYQLKMTSYCSLLIMLTMHWGWLSFQCSINHWNQLMCFSILCLCSSDGLRSSQQFQADCSTNFVGFYTWHRSLGRALFKDKLCHHSAVWHIRQISSCFVP